ncbi:MAG: hypothetical protein KAR13_20930 [Desulfobulbaceae bacterium]|nr:hypothetical protein [Desulfobulbaceae bacterium]
MKTNTSYVGLILVFLISTHLILFSGCATYEAKGVRKVDSRPIRIGVIEENFVKYFPLTVKHFPTHDNNELIVQLKKSIKQKIEYHKKSHDEQIYQLEGGPLDREAQRLKRSFDSNPIAGIMDLLLSPLMILMDIHPATYKPYSDTRYEKIPGSEKIATEYRYDTKNVLAVNAAVSLEKYGVSKTDERGEAKFVVNPVLFDEGLILHNMESNESYIIKREKIIRKYKADWYAGAKLSNDLYSIGAIAYKVRKAIILGSGTYAIAGAIIVEVASGLIIGYIIDSAANKSSEYYQWSILRISTN